MEDKATKNSVYVVNPIYPSCFFTVDKNFTSPKHWHKEIELVYVLTGMVGINVNSRRFEVNAGEVIVINGGVAHLFMDMTKDGNVKVIKFHKDILTNVNFSETNNNAISKLYENTFMCRPDDMAAKILLDVLNSEESDFRECFITSKLLEFTVYLLRNPEIVYNAYSTLEAVNSKFITSILQYINENSSRDISLQDLADHLGFSVHYCSKYIKKNTGMNFLEYLNEVRVVNAEVLLLNTDKNITEIALETGFGSSQSFNRVFKKVTGKSPKLYRKSA